MDITSEVSPQEPQKHVASSLFKSSGYSKIIPVQFRQSTFHVHEHLFGQFTSPPPRASDGTVQLGTISDAAGHAIVHYLYSGNYQTPALVQNHLTLEDCNTALLPIGLEIHAATRKYGLEPLQRYVHSQLEYYSGTLPPARVLQIVKEVIPRPDRDDSWLHEYTRSLLKSTYPDVMSLLKSELMAAEKAESTISISELFLRLMIDTSEVGEIASLEPVIRKIESLEEVVPVPTVEALLEERNMLFAKKTMRGKLRKIEQARLYEIEAMPEVQQALAPPKPVFDAGEDLPVMVDH